MLMWAAKTLVFGTMGLLSTAYLVERSLGRVKLGQSLADVGAATRALAAKIKAKFSKKPV